METERFFDLVLDFGIEWRVEEAKMDSSKSEVDIYLEYCGEVKPYDYAPVRRWRHLDTMQYQSFINARLPRFKGADGKVTTLEPTWSDKHERHTLLFESRVIDLLLATQNQTKTASLMGCGFDVVNRIMHLASKRGMEHRKMDQRDISHLSIDEKSFQKGHCYVTVLSDPAQERVLDVAEGRTKEACCQLIDDALSKQQQEQIESISMDMWLAFLNTAREKLPKAKIVHDKFHLIQYLNNAMDKVRRREVKKCDLLKNSRYVLLKNTVNLTANQKIKFDAISQANHEVSRAWQAREDFREVFHNATFQQSKSIFDLWFESVQQSSIKEVIKVAVMFANHLNGVLNAMTSKLSNANAKRLNGKIQLLKSIERGYRKFDNFRTAILFLPWKIEALSTKIAVEPK